MSARPASTPAGATSDPDQALVAVEYSLTHLARLARPSRIFGDMTDIEGRCLDRAAYSVLARIEEFGAIRLTDLAAAAEIDISTASRHVHSLEERGLLERTREPGDLRAHRLQLTDDGKTVVQCSRETRLAGIRERLGGWEADDLCQLARLLEQLVSAFAGQPGTTGDPASDKTTTQAVLEAPAT